jgi:hypothetical protein
MEEHVEATPAVLEHGRYKIFELPDGGWLISRAVDTCERCQSCGCGDQADKLSIPGMMVKMAAGMQGGGSGAVASAKAALRMVTGRDR